MINRRLIRTRVFLDLYSFFLSNQDYNKKDINNLEKEFKFSLDSLNNLDFAKTELKKIDKYAKEEEINLWATSSKH